MSRLLNRTTIGVGPIPPIKVVQFGGGNFLRAFADLFIEELNDKCGFNGSVVIVQSQTPEKNNPITKQDGLYHLLEKGYKNGRRVASTRLITCIHSCIHATESYTCFQGLAKTPSLRFVISNTTEAGITDGGEVLIEGISPITFPARLTTFLYARYQEGLPGLIILPCELIENNGIILKEIILRYAQQFTDATQFSDWINTQNIFCNTLVDRIVPGVTSELQHEVEKTTGYIDEIPVQAEPYYFWAIEGTHTVANEFPVDKLSHNIVFTTDLAQYRIRKVRILNGLHTLMTSMALLKNIHSVRSVFEDDELSIAILRILYKEILPTLRADQDALHAYARDVLERFKNPFFEHQLSSIALNSISKFRVRALPSLLDYYSIKGTIPPGIAYSLACWIRFYQGVWRGSNLPVKDLPEVIQAFNQAWRSTNLNQMVYQILANTTLWGQDLTTLEGLPDLITLFLDHLAKDQSIHLDYIRTEGETFKSNDDPLLSTS
ncbi:tagaturonate reductase [Chryseolinea lacunae]|uniref:Tagaturonate reductase n=1 Tax=Chryseolinea lacunae TaxID=2801331 RepID=A0ABS1L5D2_9BACT|nr:tagaturonate reductase [Chryseolinea lacunae]MBL0745761.1 tagaturonate reductase [Chryseolinea lacunae]